MGAGAFQNQYTKHWYLITRRLCHVFKINFETTGNSKVSNLAFAWAMCPIVLFSACNISSILPMYFEHVVSFRFGIQATFGPYVSLPFALQAALGHETTVCVTFGARRRNTYFCRCHGYATIACFTSILGAAFLPTPFPMWFGAHSAMAMSGLCDVDSQQWLLRMPSSPASLDS